MQADDPPTDADLEATARRLGAVLTERGRTLASAESCTGGLLGHVITQVPGSSAYYLGGIVSYADEIKRELLGVATDVLDQHGAVSSPVAEAMAAGALARFGAADLTVAVTGVAGPDGGSAAKPVGLTFVAAALRGGGTSVERHAWPHDRAGNKRASALAALELATRLASEG